MSPLAYVVREGHALRVDLQAAPAEAGDLVWIHFPTAEAETRRWLEEKAGLPDYVAEALTASETRPRCIAVDGGALVNLRGLSTAKLASSDLLASVRIFARGGQVFSVTRKPVSVLPLVCDAVVAGRVLDPGDLIATFASGITEQLDPDVADLGDLLDDCEEGLDTRRVFEQRRTVTRVRARAIGYRRFLTPQRAAIERLAALDVDWLSDEDRRHLATAADRAARMAEELESIRERSALMHEALTDLRAEQIDQRALTISIVAVVFLPLTFITGLLGMNVAGIPYAHEPWAFWGVVAVCAVLAAAISVYFIARHWFRG